MDLIKQDSATREDMGLLAVMDALADEEQITQRELSRRTGLNLKKVNYCLHKLLEKGHVKFQRVVNNPDKRAYLYILTPAGFKAKSHLTYRFLKFTLDFYNQVDIKLRRCLRDMAAAGVKRIVLCGASDAAKIVLGLVAGNGIEVVGVVDSGYDADQFDGLLVLQGEDLGGLQWDGMLITALEELEEVESQLRDWGLPEEQIWRLS
jgi:DNA-binding MarR family transcriptional regulator